ncbi:MAG: TIGR03087 family PEP-CTERM/XrtA system glycosyltransferase [Hydrogenophilaceae bacterium]|nr:TIGR03087 family PEP-CTERM/XrtA system glycosyltransferase [Hydrogenophilaceae bacterium]
MKENLLFLSHRLPYPPNKGDKIRSYHLLRCLAERYNIFLGAFIDDPADRVHVDALRQWCAEVKVIDLNPRLAKLASLRGLWTDEALTLPYYRNASLFRWAKETVSQYRISIAVAFSSAMAQFVPPDLTVRIMDMVDVDSDKWAQYAPTKPWPLSWLYRREAKKLAGWECCIARDFNATLLVSGAEAAHLKRMAADAADKIDWFENGVDADFFQPDPACPSPYAHGTTPIVFTGAMDYWPNIDAVTWFASEIFPRVRDAIPDAMFAIVGSNPSQAVKTLGAQPGVWVTGRVDDVRPYVQHAACAIAPLRLARGVQNKVLEAMAMARPVVTSPQAAEGISAQAGENFLVADNAADFAAQVTAVCKGLFPDMGAQARARILLAYDWQTNLSRILPHLEASRSSPAHESSSCLS